MIPEVFDKAVCIVQCRSVPLRPPDTDVVRQIELLDLAARPVRIERQRKHCRTPGIHAHPVAGHDITWITEREDASPQSIEVCLLNSGFHPARPLCDPAPPGTQAEPIILEI